MGSGGDLAAVTKTCRSCSGRCKMVVNKVMNKPLSLVGDLLGHNNGPEGLGASVLCVS